MHKNLYLPRGHILIWFSMLKVDEQIKRDSEGILKYSLGGVFSISNFGHRVTIFSVI